MQISVITFRPSSDSDLIKVTKFAPLWHGFFFPSMCYPLWLFSTFLKLYYCFVSFWKFKMQASIINKCFLIASTRGKDRLPLPLFVLFLAHFAKGNVSFCHHLASVVCRPLSFHILIFPSETPQPYETW